jgi:hypothetical protein
MGAPRTEEKRDVLDVLYEGGDESALSDAERGELAQWRELRGALRELPDAEPPDSMAVLLAAAREHERAKAPRGVWARLRAWFSVLAAHPAISAAATVVVVAGVAGAFYMTGRVGSDSNERVSAVSAETGAKPPAPRLPTPEPPGAGAAAGSGSAAPIQEQTAPAVEDVPAANQREVEVPKDALKSKESPRTKPTAAHATPPRVAPPTQGKGKGETRDRAPDNLGTTGETIDGLVDGDVARGGAGAGPGGGGGGGAVDEGEEIAVEKVPAPAPVVAPAPPPPPAPPAPHAQANTDADAGADTPTAAPAPQRPAQRGRGEDAPSLTRQAITAAKKKDCKTVGALATRVFALDEGYFRSTFATDPDIRDNCGAATRR